MEIIDHHIPCAAQPAKTHHEGALICPQPLEDSTKSSTAHMDTLFLISVKEPALSAQFWIWQRDIKATKAARCVRGQGPAAPVPWPSPLSPAPGPARRPPQPAGPGLPELFTLVAGAGAAVAPVPPHCRCPPRSPEGGQRRAGPALTHLPGPCPQRCALCARHARAYAVCAARALRCGARADDITESP